MYQRKRSDFRHVRSALGLFALGASLAASTTAGAAPANPYGGGSRIPSKSETVDRGHHQTRLILRDFAKCSLKGRREDVRRYLLEDVGEAETAKLRRKAINANCLSGEIGPDEVRMRLTGVSLQGALAEQMLLADGLLSQPLDTAEIAPLHHSELKAEDLKKMDTQGRELAFAQEYVFRFGECVVRADAAQSAALLQTDPDTEAESVAFGQLMPAFRSCVEVNRTLTGDKIEIRGTVAYNYYRLVSAPRVAQSVSAGKN